MMQNLENKRMKQLAKGRRFSLQPCLVGSVDEGCRGCLATKRSPSTQDLTDIAENEVSTTPPKKLYKVVLMGAAGVGKTSLVSQFLYDTFDPRYKKTVEEYHRADYEIFGIPLTLDILDTSGSYAFPAMRQLSINNSDAFVLVYTLEDQESFQEVQSLREQIVEIKGLEIPIVVVGNKHDLVDRTKLDLAYQTERMVVDEWGHGFVLASAKDNTNVIEVFKALLHKANIRFALSPAVRRRRQSLPGNRLTPAGSSTKLLKIIKVQGEKRNSCVIS